MSDESIVTLSDEAKSAMRNYTTMAGFFMIFLYSVYFMTADSAEECLNDTSVAMLMATGVLLTTVGVILAMLHKRDMFAMCFILLALVSLVEGLCRAPSLELPIGIVLIAMSLSFLMTANEQRYVSTILMLITGVTKLTAYAMVSQPDMAALLDPVLTVETVALIVILLYCVLCIGCEAFRLPGRDMLIVDEEVPENDGIPVHFKVAGSSIGFALLAITGLTYAFMMLGCVSLTGPISMDQVCAAMMFIVGIVMLVAGRMRGTPMYFICTSFVLFLCNPANPLMAVSGAFVIAAVLLLRRDRRVLYAILMVLFAISIALAVPAMQGDFVIVPIILDFAAAAIGLYLVFALNSNGRLRLF